MSELFVFNASKIALAPSFPILLDERKKRIGIKKFLFVCLFACNKLKVKLCDRSVCFQCICNSFGSFNPNLIFFFFRCIRKKTVCEKSIYDS